MDNNLENQEIDSIRIPWLKTIIFCALFFGLTSICAYIYQFGIGLWDTPEKWGSLGDFFGGVLNPFLAFLSLILLLITLNQNQKALAQNKIALDQNKDALEINSQELELTRQEVSGSREALEAQAAILEVQNFEGTFFQLISLYNEIIATTKIHDHEGRETFISFYNLLSNSIKPNVMDVNQANIGGAYEVFYRSRESLIGPYFRIIFNILKFIEDSSIDNKRKYSDLLRAQLSSFELVLIFYHCLTDDNIDDFKPFVESYSILKFLPRERLYLDGRELELYDDSAYEE